MINYKNVLKNILLKEEEKFFHGLSFIITSLIALHIVIYFNFYKFSSNWIELESKKTTFILTNNFEEKEIPLSIKENIVDYLVKNESLEIKKQLLNYGHQADLMDDKIDDLTLINFLSQNNYDFVFRVNRGRPRELNKKIRFISWFQDFYFDSESELESLIEGDI